jgi:two-component system CheB/CheR fusion protein
MSPETDPGFEELLDYVRDNRGFDFTGYKRASLMRRIRKRMQEVGIGDFASYQDYLEVHPNEFTSLFNTILINVTSFFRDEETWQLLAREVLPEIVARKTAGESIRIWCAGCASGEEAYTLAILVAEAVGDEEKPKNVKIYATDVDEEALAQGRSAVYSAKALESLPAELREKYFESRDGDLFAVRQDLRGTVIFGRHDLVSDAPISRVDLISCRNTLMYFNAEAQSRIYRNFHFALQPNAFLLLGKSEMLFTRTDIFAPADMKRHLFVRVGPAEEARGAAPQRMDVDELLRRAVFEGSTVAQVVVDAEGVLVEANNRARADFGVDARDLGRPFSELELSYRPLELRSKIERAARERRSNLETAVRAPTSTGDERILDIEVMPVFDHDRHIGTTIAFVDVSHASEIRADLERSRRELETAYEELQSTVEELETTNEELQSTNEELETTNEELQSTNEELETMNEELHSTNEELETMNTELIDRTEQLDESKSLLESILGSMQAAVIVLDRKLEVQSWNTLAEELWGLRAEEATQKNLLGLDIGLPVEELRKPIREVLNGATDAAKTALDAVDRRGKHIRCTVTCNPLKGDDGAPPGVMLLVECARR